jgi:hypothetical protein
MLDGLQSYDIHTSLYDKQTYDEQPNDSITVGVYLRRCARIWMKTHEPPE